MASNSSTSAAGSHQPLTVSPDVTKTAQTAMVDIATKARDKAQAVAQAAADTVDQSRGAAARVLSDAASTIHDGARRLPGGEGGVARLADTAAEKIDSTARYMREHDTHQMMADLRQFVRRHPGVSLVGAAVAGVLVGLRFRKR
jgi:ElaB/YqjD/DUF883 family membrane-anchored ribosome-binding protein